MKMINAIQAMSLSVFLAASCTPVETTTTENNTTTTEVSAPEPIASMPTLASLEKDPDVIWMGEVEVDCALNYSRWSYDREAKERLLMESLGFNGRNSSKILKYQVTNFNRSHNDDHSLFDKVLRSRDDIKLYKESSLETVCTKEEVEYDIGRVDTIITFDPNTKEELVQVVVNALSLEDIKGFRVRQVIYYSKKAMAFKSVALAVAPLLYEYGEEAPSRASLKPIFWMKATAVNSVPNLASLDVTWAKRMYRDFDLSTVKVIKQEQDIAKIIAIMMTDFRANPEKTKIAHTFDSDGTEYFSSKDVKGLGASIDTIITFDPITFKEEVKVVETKMDDKSIKKLRLIQDWVWNDKTQSLSIRYVGFAPIINRVDNDGKFLNSGPMFIRKVEDIQ
jgi:hypothetical protein